MRKHLGRSDDDSVIDSLPDARYGRPFLVEAIARFGPQILDPFKDSIERLTTVRRRSKLRLHNAQHNALSEPWEVGQPMLSESFIPAPVGGRWVTEDVPKAMGDSVEKYGSRFRARGTLQRYWFSWRRIIRLCLEHNVCPLPMSAGTAMGIVAHIADSGASFGEVRAIRSTIAFVHAFKRLQDPTKDPGFRRVWNGIARSLGTGHPNAKIALTRAEVGEMIALAIKRRRPDHAVSLAVCFEGALRGSELCGARIEDVYHLNGTTHVLIPRSKNDQTSEGAWIKLDLRENAPFDASAMLLEWIKRLNKPTGYLFGTFEKGVMLDEPMQIRTFRRTVKFYAACIGIDPKLVGVHSLRAGWVTEELSLGRPTHEVIVQCRHKSLNVILAYYRPRGTPRNITRYADPGIL